MQDNERHHHTTDEVMIYSFTRLPYGLTCSPFLLSTLVWEHADRHNIAFSTASPLIDSKTYMDDFAASAEDDNEAITIYYELTAIKKLINLPLANWASNSDQFKAIWRAEGRDIETQTKVLGVNWDKETDCVFFDFEANSNNLPEWPTTLRQLLQATARFYDPLGFYSPGSVVG